MLEHTKEELEALHKERLNKLLIYVGGYNHLAKMLNVASSTTQSWEERNRISKKGAEKAEKNERLKTAGFTAKYLRPDL